jgi:putative tryptophan/tyrosine transport system substrate-binding protein
MRRREFITLFGGAVASSLLHPLAARAQQPDHMRRIGVLAGLAENDPEISGRLAGFRQGLEKLGWVEGGNVRIDYRFAPGGTQARVLARELVSLRPDVILGQSTPAVAALQLESRTIPIVFAGIADPIGSGFVMSLARPGGNLTGLLLYEEGITGKWLGMLREIAPRLERAALVANPKTTSFDYFLRSAKALAPSLAIDIVPSPVENAADIERTIESFAREPNGGLVLPPDITTVAHRDLIIALAARHHLPAVYTLRVFVAAGGLMFYGTDFVDLFRQAASYVDHILRGAKPADLPMQTPTRYETVVNLKTAKTLGIDVPPSLLVRADEVME